MKFRLLLVGALVGFVCSGTALYAQGAAIIARDGWEGFPAVWYEGGDSTQPKRLTGILILTDTTLALYPCPGWRDCRTFRTTKTPFKDAPYFTIQLADIKKIGSSSPLTPSGADLLAFGVFSGNGQDVIALVYETATNAEAPLFHTETAQAAALEAKIRFRLKKLGVTLSGGDDKPKP